MSAAPFDTLELAQKLDAAGLSGQQPEGLSRAPAGALRGRDVVSRGCLADRLDALERTLTDWVAVTLAAVVAESRWKPTVASWHEVSIPAACMPPGQVGQREVPDAPKAEESVRGLQPDVAGADGQNPAAHLAPRIACRFRS